MVINTDRFADLRNRHSQELAALSTLSAIPNKFIQGEVQKAKNFLGDVARILKDLDKPKSPSDEAGWVSLCNITFDIAAKHRQTAEQMLAKYGPKVKAYYF